MCESINKDTKTFVAFIARDGQVDTALRGAHTIAGRCSPLLQTGQLLVQLIIIWMIYTNQWCLSYSNGILII